MTATDTDVLRALDFTPAIPCSHHEHATRHAGDEPAAWHVISLCPHCQHLAKPTLCEPGRRLMASGIVACRVCRGTGDWARFVLVLERIGEGR